MALSALSRSSPTPMFSGAGFQCEQPELWAGV